MIPQQFRSNQRSVEEYCRKEPIPNDTPMCLCTAAPHQRNFKTSCSRGRVEKNGQTHETGEDPRRELDGKAGEREKEKERACECRSNHTGRDISASFSDPLTIKTKTEMHLKEGEREQEQKTTAVVTAAEKRETGEKEGDGVLGLV
ncbi:uncharacterized protein LOC143526905 [Brachyhypopomus gauderio]|uniref:uncharacterized protein LOC143526905 n=1 Tax=Brachyhypopomus gauderio TaxID=698409 RepID=UPI0040438648